MGGLEAEHQRPRCPPSPAPVTSASVGSSSRQFAGLRPDCARALAPPRRPRRSSAKATPRPRALWAGRSWTRTQASVITPRMPSEPISIRSGLGPAPEPGQPPALPGAGRGDRAHRLDQVVDVGVDGREVAAGAGRDPAAERRELERLREVAQGEPVLARAGPRAPGRARRPGSAPRARPRSTSSTRSSRAEVDRHRAGVARRRLAARRRRRRWCRPRTGSPPAPASAHQASTASTSRLVARARDQVRRVVDLAAKAADDVAVGLAERVRDALAAVVADDLRERRRGGSAAAAAARSPRAAPAPRRRRRRSRAARAPRSRPAPCARGSGLLVLESPAPVLARPLAAHRGRPGPSPTSARRASGWRTATCWLFACSSAVARCARPAPPTSSRPSPRSSRGTGGRRC